MAGPSLIAPDETIVILALLFIAVVVGIRSEQKKWIKGISGVLITIGLGAVMATVGLFPSASDTEIEVPAYALVYEHVVPLSIPLLLFQINLGKIIKESGRMLVVFLIGSISVAIGVIFATFIIDLGSESHKLAAVFVGTYTGGSVNFMSLAAMFDFMNSPVFSTAITIDNVFTNLFFMLLFGLPAISWLRKCYVDFTPDAKDQVEQESSTSMLKKQSYLYQLGITLCIALVVVGIARLLDPWVQQLINTTMSMEILLITIIITIIANTLPHYLEKLQQVAFDAGMLFLYLFLAVIGAACDLTLLLDTSMLILAFVSITLMIHLLLILMVGRLLGVSLEEILVASAANIGGPSIAAPMAAQLGLKSLVTPGILVGILGYLIGTFLGLGTGLLLAP